MSYLTNKTQLEKDGYSVVSSLFSEEEISEILNCIENTEQTGNAFMQTRDLFAIRQLIKNVPQLSELLFTESMTRLIYDLFESTYFLTKAIYFDKPSESNWFVAYHQDLSISVNQKVNVPNYSNWTFKKGQYGVQPPLKILQDTITLRVHLDNTDRDNGALKIIPKSHQKGIIRKDSKNWNTKDEVVCEAAKGSVMLMKPLTLHASNRTTNGKKRRVIHLEFNKNELTKPLDWLEREEITHTMV